MRLDQWQKWLEEQFLDTNPPKPETKEEPPAKETSGAAAELPSAEVPAPKPAVMPASTAQPESRAPAVPAPEGVSGSAELRAAPVRRAGSTSAGVPTSVDLPPLEDYLPFLRPRAEDKEEAPVVPPSPVSVQEAHGTAPQEALPAESGPGATSASPEPEGTIEPTAETPSGTLFAEQVDGNAAHVMPAAAPTASAEPQRPARKRRARPAKPVTPPELAPPLTSEEFWELAPRHIRTLISLGQDEGVQKSYRRRFKESRLALIERLLDPTLSLEEAARLLNVCPATVRRYTNRGQLRHFRTAGDQRRFKLSDVLAFLEAQHSQGATRSGDT